MSSLNAASRPDPHEREQTGSASADIARLIETNLSYSHAIAGEVLRRLPPDLEKKDIEGWAELGLVEAANSFDRTRGVQFKTFAYYRIKGAVYDGLRKMGWYSKAQYRQIRFAVAANEYMKDASSTAARPASAEDQLQDLKDLAANITSCYMLSLDALPQEPIDQNQVSAEDSVVHEQERRNVRKSLAQLPDTNRQVLEYCYFQGLTLEEVGRKLNLSKSWVCRLHAKSIEMLRKQLTQAAIPTSPTSATFLGIVR